MNIKRFFKGGCFVFLWLWIFSIVTYILRPNSDIRQRFSGFYYQDKDTIDIIYIGSSPVSPYWASPLVWNEYGITSWPLSSNVQPPAAAKCLLREALKYQNPQLVIFDIRMFSYDEDMFVLNESAIRQVIDNMKLSWNRLFTVSKLVDKSQPLHYYFFDICKYHSQWKHLSQINYEYWDNERVNLLGGHDVVSDVMDLSSRTTDYNGIKKGMVMPVEQEIFLRDLLDYCKEEEVEALFTINPFVGVSEEKQMMFNYMGKIIHDEYGYNIIDYDLLYENINVDFSKDFYNEDHMNINGAIKFTESLAEYIHTTYDINDRRTEKKTAERWNAIYQNWINVANEAVDMVSQKIEEKGEDE